MIQAQQATEGSLQPASIVNKITPEENTSAAGEYNFLTITSGAVYPI
jgi:hypothetical protein